MPLRPHVHFTTAHGVRITFTDAPFITKAFHSKIRTYYIII